jgi:hypothetical protein
MALRAYTDAHPETVQNLELASGDRFWEGFELLVAGRTAGTVYLLGYVAEMVLKNACFLFDGARPADPVKPRLGPYRALARQHFPAIERQRENYHSLVFWYTALLWRRRLARRPLAPRLARQLGRRVARVHGMWTVAMRYYPDGQVLPNVSRSLYDDVLWIYDHRLELTI